MVAVRSLPARPSQPPLQAAPYLRLPPGSTRPQGWLKTQLQKQLDGLCGNLATLSSFVDEETTGWIRPNSQAKGWEEAPYWLRGYVPLAISLRDPRALNTVKRWVDGIIATQADDGFFGPLWLRGGGFGKPGDNGELHGGNGDGDSADLWSHLVMMQAVRTYAEFTGDKRVVPFFSRFFSYTASAVAEDPRVITRRWINYRWAEALDLIGWTYTRTCDESLLELARTLHHGSANWLDPDHVPTPHNVNIAQGFREPALYAQFSGDAAHVGATYAMYDAVMGRYGQFPGGGFAGDENIREGYSDPRQGFEICGIVEMMASHEALARVTGDALWADRAEELAFNNLPAGLDFEGKAAHYVNCANCVALLDRTPRHGQYDNRFPMEAYATDPNADYRCCVHNYGLGWPYYLEEMWVRRAQDGGIVANLHGPSEVTFPVGDDDTSVTIEAHGSYPFSESITYAVKASRPAKFNFWVRIPSWAERAEFTSPTGALVAVDRPNTYHLAVEGHEWHTGDQLVVWFPMQARTKTWQGNHNAVSVYFGPQAFSLKISEDWVKVGGTEEWPRREVRPLSPWNYALILDELHALEVTRSHGNHLDPFCAENTPLKMTAKAKRVDEWRADEDGVVGGLAELGDAPVAVGKGVESEDVLLIPMGAARLRVTAFPTC